MPSVFDIFRDRDHELASEKQEKCKADHRKDGLRVRGKNKRLADNLPRPEPERADETHQDDRADQAVRNDVLDFREHIDAVQIGCDKEQQKDDTVDGGRNLPAEDRHHRISEHRALNASGDRVTDQIPADHRDDRDEGAERCERVLRKTARQVRHQRVQLRKGERCNNVDRARDQHRDDKRNANCAGALAERHQAARRDNETDSGRNHARESQFFRIHSRISSPIQKNHGYIIAVRHIRLTCRRMITAYILILHL